ncbi:DUF1365 domain-containing protein [Alphaproteobacteria bacterium LSUCC0684]
MQACCLVRSSIIHTRHQPASHRLERRGLSIWLDLDRLDEAGRLSAAFAIGRFNLLSFDEKDYGPNFAAGRKLVEPLADYARRLARQHCPDTPVARVRLLTFPRILGAAFNPISVYLCYDDQDKPVFCIYEVRNTFGDMHSYIAAIDGRGAPVHEVEKMLHVSPFFPVKGEYRLKIRAAAEKISLLIDYQIEGKQALTASLRGDIIPLSSRSILTGLIWARLFPMRPLVSIHIEALKLWAKNVPFFARPEPPATPWSEARTRKKDPA